MLRVRIFPHLRPGFTDAPLDPPRPPSPPRYPCFALADLIRDSALNLVRYTAVCMPRLALPATSATHKRVYTNTRTRTRPLPAHIILCTRTRLNTATQPYPGSPFLSPFHPARPRCLANEDRYTPPTLFFPIPPVLLFPLLPCRLLCSVPLALTVPRVLSRYLYSLPLSLISVSIWPSSSLPLSHRL